MSLNLYILNKYYIIIIIKYIVKYYMFLNTILCYIVLYCLK